MQVISMLVQRRRQVKNLMKDEKNEERRQQLNIRQQVGGSTISWLLCFKLHWTHLLRHHADSHMGFGS